MRSWLWISSLKAAGMFFFPFVNSTSSIIVTRSVWASRFQPNT
jgi:hypothetical protein